MHNKVVHNLPVCLNNYIIIANVTSIILNPSLQFIYIRHVDKLRAEGVQITITLYTYLIFIMKHLLTLYYTYVTKNPIIQTHNLDLEYVTMETKGI